MSTINLLYVVNEFVEASTNTLILNTIKRLDPNDYRVFVGAVKGNDGAMTELLQAAGATVVPLTPGNPLLNSRRVIRAEEIDIVHTHVLRADLLGGLAARLAGNCTLISTKHNVSYVRTQQGWLWRGVLYWPVIYLADHVVLVTDSARRHVTKLPFFNPQRAITIPNGIDVDRYVDVSTNGSIRRKFGISSDAVLLIYLGRLVSGKGLEDLLDAMRLLRGSSQPIHLLIAGDGPLRPRLAALVAEYTLKGVVTFAGFRRDVPELLTEADVFVLPSYTEGLPLSLLEAMAAGTVPVVTPINGMGEAVADGETGLFVWPGATDALAAAITQLADSSERRKQMGHAAQRHVREYYSIAHMAAAYDRLYRTCITGTLYAKGIPTS